MKPILGLASIAVLLGCASAKYEVSEEAAERLAEFERTGETESCLRLTSIRSVTPLDPHNFLVRIGVDRYYLNQTSGCTSAGRPGYRLEYTTSMAQLCRNQIVSVVDNTTGFMSGSCGLGAFERLEKLPEEEPDEEKE